MRDNGSKLKDIADSIGCTKTCVLNWYKVYKEKGEYYLMSQKDIKNGRAKDVSNLQKQVKELEEQNFKLTLQNDVYEAALKILKKCPALSLKENLQDLTASTKVEIVIILRAKYKLRSLFDVLDLKKRSYYNQLKRMNTPCKWDDYDRQVLEFINNNPMIKCKKGYRCVMHAMKTSDEWTLPISERRIRKVMQDNNLLAYQSNTMTRYNSYKKDGKPPVKNWLYDKLTNTHFFHPDCVWQILGTDVTEFQVNGFKVYFSPIIDFFDSMPITWKISKHPDTDLIVGSVEKLIKIANGKSFVLHMDQGSVNRSDKMKETCENNHILQSMSRKGKSGDNAPTEGFFGRLKQEWFNKTDFTGYTYDMFVASLEDYIYWYKEYRLSIKLKTSPMKYRMSINDTLISEAA
jgi:transposase InsO family protein